MGTSKKENRLIRVLDALEAKLRRNRIDCDRESKRVLVVGLPPNFCEVEIEPTEDEFIYLTNSSPLDQFDNTRLEVLESINTIHNQLPMAKISIDDEDPKCPFIVITSEVFVNSTVDFYDKFVEYVILMNNCTLRLNLSLQKSTKYKL